jgi:hypothetical protein
MSGWSVPAPASEREFARTSDLGAKYSVSFPKSSSPIPEGAGIIWDVEEQNVGNIEAQSQI